MKVRTRMTSWTLPATALGLALLIASACSSGGGTGTNTSLPPEDTLKLCSDKVDNDENGMTDCADSSCSGATDSAIKKYCAKQQDAKVDDSSNDKDADSGGTTDEVVDDASDATATDAADGSGSCLLAGSFGCPCTSNSDCDSNYCINGDQGKFCTKPCVDTCPTDFKCVSAGSGDLNYICVPAYPTLCMPCKEHKDCQWNGSTDNYCVPFDRSQDGGGGQVQGFIDGSFCMVACGPKDVCKAGYHCQELKLFDGGMPVKQCVPDSGECGCQDSWATSGISTECKKTSAAGQCVSKRQCVFNSQTQQAVLTACDAPAPSKETCGDSVDNDCNGKTDEPGADGCVGWYQDNDGDSYGTGVGTCLCENPGGGYANLGGDCNDFVSSIHPGGSEICDNIDNDCDGSTDESGAKGCTVFYHDLDGDGYGNPNDSACLCKSKQTSEWILQAADCDDTPGPGAKIHPGVDEACDGADNNCNGKIDEQGAIGCQLYYVDQDNDTYGVTSTGLCLCAASKSNTAGMPGDCDDSNGAINPGSPEVCDAVDNDCNGTTDDGAADATCGAIAGGSSKCIDGACGVGTCQKGYYDVNADPSDGCECQDVSSVGGKLGQFCGNAIDLGDLPDGSATIQKAGQILPGEAGDWFKFNAKDAPDIGTSTGGNCDQYDVRISFVYNPGNLFVFDVYRGSCGAGDQVCSAETSHDWSTSFYGPPPFGPKNKANSNSLGENSKSPFPEAAGECNCVPPNAKFKPCSYPDNKPPPIANDPNFIGCGPNGLPGMNLCSDNSAWYYVRVYTKPGVALTCDQYIIKFDNSATGAPPPQN